MLSTVRSAGDTILAADHNNDRKDLLLSGGDFATSTGSANAYILALDAQLTAYAAGLTVRFLANFTNTGAATINVNGIGVATIVKMDGTALEIANILSGGVVTLVYDGSNFRLITPASGGMPVGSIIAYPGATAPLGWQLCDGTSLSKTTYSALHSIINFTGGEGAINTKMTATFTADAGTDTCTSAGHGLHNDVPVILTTTTTLPGGLSAATIYWIINTATNTFQLSATRGGSAINITSAGTGTHTWTQWMEADATTDYLYTQAHGLSAGDIISFSSSGSLPTGLTALTNYYVINPTTDTFQVSTTLGGSAVNITAVGTVNGSSYIKNFLVWDARGKVLVGKNGATFATLGGTGGEETHVLTVAELAAHTHTIPNGGSTNGNPGGSGTTSNQVASNTGSNGSGTAHNNLQPYIVGNYIVKL